MTDALVQHSSRGALVVRTPDDAWGLVSGERALEFRTFDSLIPGPDDPRPCDPRIPAAVSVAFRRSVARLRAEREFSPACDLVATDAGPVLASICEAVRHVYLRRPVGPLNGGAVALQVFDRLRRIFVEELDAQREALRTGQLSEAMRVFDTVRDQIERDESQRFASALRSGDALGLVVEIAHDMRSPLTAILMLTEMARRPQGSGPDEAQERQLGLVYSAAFGLNALVNDVLALARGGDRLIEREPVPFSVSAVMHSVADMLRPIAEDQKLELRVTTPSVSGRIGQPIALSRVLLNLASNALKATETGEVSISAEELRAGHVRFAVADTGPGIPDEVLPALFEPFGKRPTSVRGRRFSRTGLGLAICRKLLRDMGSELRVQSAPGRGTRFFFELTLPPADDADGLGTSSGALLL